MVSALMLSSVAFAQLRPNDKTLDINYTATYKSDFSVRWSSKLAESQDWAIKGFNTGAAYNLNRGANRFALTYDLWRGAELNAPLSQRYGMSYSSQSRFSNLSFSVFQIQTPNQPSVIQGRIDLNMKFGN
jgi:hypothetical protein